MDPQDSPFLERLQRQVLVFDGAMGTSIHALELPLEDYDGLENCNEILNVTRPDVIESIHRGFLEAGCDVIETNSFGGPRHVLAEFGLAGRCRELAFQAARIARRAVEAFATPAHPRFVAGSVGPGTRLITLRQIDYDALVDSYLDLVCGLLEGGVDLLAIETCQDILQCKAAIQAARLAFERTGRCTPLMVSVTVETTGTMLVGADIGAALTAIEAFPEVQVIGLNCATGPQEMSEHVRYLSRACTRFISVMPNAGLPQVIDGRTHFPLTPGELARWLKEFVETDGVDVVGGCCGTTPAHLKAVVQALRGGPIPLRRRPRAPQHEPAVSSSYQSVPLRQQSSFLIVGERCNTNGSRRFRELVAAEDYDGCVQMALEQVRDEGAHVLDVCVDYVGRDGVADMRRVIDRFAREVPAPLMLDSTQPEVIEAGLKLAGGKCIVNSVNLEEGEAKLGRIARLCRQYGAAVVALTIDEDPVEAMAKTAARKLAIATRIRDLLVERHGLREEDIFFDCLTFPITTGNEADRRLALETLDGLERVMKAFPRCQSILGVSNVSFGLQPAARAVLNSVFLHEAVQRGLTAAIVHAGRILPRSQISDQRWQAALDLIYDRRSPDDPQSDPLARFIALFGQDELLGTRPRLAELPVEQRLRQRIIDGQRSGIEADLEEALGRYSPLDIINTFLLDGMKTVGELFASGQMQLPFVLKSAECMKAAVAWLEPRMEKRQDGSRGKIVLATVRGDVHDIGKNLVDIILTNNGYTVYNLGIKQPIANVIAAWREHGADAIGLSGLLVKSTLVMRDDLLVLNEQGIRAPVILGGAALTRRYVEEDLRPLYHGPLFYAKDAFAGLHLMGQIAARGEPQPSRERQDRDEPVASASTPGSGLERQLEQRYGLAEIGDEEPDQALQPQDEVLAGDVLTAGAPVPCSALPSTPAGSPQRRPSTAKPVAAPGRARVVPAGPVGTGPGAVEAEAVARTGADYPAPALNHEHPVPRPPFWGARVLEEIPLKAVLGYINEIMLFQVQWGFRKRGRSREEFKRYIDSEVRPIYRELVERCQRDRIITPRAIYGYWPCHSDGDELIVYEPPAASSSPGEAGGTSAPAPVGPLRERMRFRFPRQKSPPYRCLADFWRPRPMGPVAGEYDVVAFSIVTAGPRVSEVAREWFAQNRYQQYLFLHGLGVETAEALAEYIHKQVRMELGIAQRDARDVQRLFQQGYQGARYSFGYPACPNLEDQAKLFELLDPQRIGVTLSEQYQLEPEQSTSAIITAHPAARYFNVR